MFSSVFLHQNILKLAKTRNWNFEIFCVKISSKRNVLYLTIFLSSKIDKKICHFEFPVKKIEFDDFLRNFFTVVFNSMFIINPFSTQNSQTVLNLGIV